MICPKGANTLSKSDCNGVFQKSKVV
jgi:hypothetical protein